MGVTDYKATRDPIAAAYSHPPRQHDPENLKCPACGRAVSCSCGGVVHRCEDGTRICSRGCRG
jgi:hypothetical protein